MSYRRERTRDSGIIIDDPFTSPDDADNESLVWRRPRSPSSNVLSKSSDDRRGHADHDYNRAQAYDEERMSRSDLSRKRLKLDASESYRLQVGSWRDHSHQHGRLHGRGHSSRHSSSSSFSPPHRRTYGELKEQSSWRESRDTVSSSCYSSDEIHVSNAKGEKR